MQINIANHNNNSYGEFKYRINKNINPIFTLWNSFFNPTRDNIKYEKVDLFKKQKLYETIWFNNYFTGLKASNLSTLTSRVVIGAGSIFIYGKPHCILHIKEGYEEYVRLCILTESEIEEDCFILLIEEEFYDTVVKNFYKNIDDYNNRILNNSSNYLFTVEAGCGFWRSLNYRSYYTLKNEFNKFFKECLNKNIPYLILKQEDFKAKFELPTYNSFEELKDLMYNGLNSVLKDLSKEFPVADDEESEEKELEEEVDNYIEDEDTGIPF